MAADFDWNDWWRYGYVRPWIGLGWWPGYYDYGYGYPYYDYYGYGYPSVRILQLRLRYDDYTAATIT